MCTDAPGGPRSVPLRRARMATRCQHSVKPVTEACKHTGKTCPEVLPERCAQLPQGAFIGSQQDNVLEQRLDGIRES